MNQCSAFVDASKQRSLRLSCGFLLVILLSAATSPGHSADLDMAHGCRQTQTSLPAPAFGGAFYGSPFAGTRTANASIRRYQNGMMFRAERTGQIDAIRYQNRLLTDETIEERCRASGEPWCNCLEHDLDGNACGWTTPNMYHAGNGGLQIVSLHHDDDSEHHWPDEETVLARSSPYYPIDYPADAFLTVTFQTPATLIKGRYYHLVWTNSDTAPSKKFTKQDNSIAASWSANFGAIGLNGWQFQPHEKKSNPVYRHNKIYGRDDPMEPFSTDDNNLAFYSIHYSDDHWLGDVYTRIHAEIPGKGGYSVGGDHRVRQAFTVEGEEREIDGIWALTRLEAGTGDVTVTIKNSVGNVLSSAVFANDRLSVDDTWTYELLSSPVRLKPDEDYVAEFSAPSGTAVYMSANFPMDYPPYLAEHDRNNWGGAATARGTAFALRSDDGGLSWTSFGDTPYLGRDLNVVFTVSGEREHVALPGIKLDHFLSFEESEQVWAHPPGGVLTSSEPLSDHIQGARYRGLATARKAAEIEVTDVTAYTGCRSVEVATDAVEDGEAFASLAIAGDRSKQIRRRMREGVDYWFGFAMKNLIARHNADWEIYAMWHNPSAPPPGWGETDEPQVALVRLDDDRYGVVYRYNLSDGSTIATQLAALPLLEGEWQRFVFRLRLDNQDGARAKGIIEVWTAGDGEPLKQYIDLHDINIGFRYSGKDEGPIPMLTVYNGGRSPTAHKVYFDDWRISSDEKANEHALDPSTYR